MAWILTERWEIEFVSYVYILFTRGTRRRQKASASYGLPGLWGRRKRTLWTCYIGGLHNDNEIDTPFLGSVDGRLTLHVLILLFLPVMTHK